MAAWHAHLRLLGAAATTTAASAPLALSSARRETPERERKSRCRPEGRFLDSGNGDNSCHHQSARFRIALPSTANGTLRRPLLAQEILPTQAAVGSQESPKKRVCCIGAGAAGLACAKEMLERGFDVTVLESREGVGGVWRVDTSGKHVGVRIGQRATSSKYYLGFSDYPMSDSAEDFPSNADYIKYLDGYVDHFNIGKCILFGRSVLGVRQNEADNVWEVRLALPSGKEEHLRFDAVAVCSGLHSAPDFPPAGVPSPPPEFNVSLVHSMALKDAEAFLKGKRTIIVGGGETGAELAHAAAVVGKTPAIFSLRRGITVIGSYMPLPLEGRVADSRTPPVDLNERRVVSLLPSGLKHFVFTRRGVFELRDDHPGKYSVTRLLASLSFQAFSLVTLPFFIAGNAVAEVVETVSQPQFWALSKPDFSPPDGAIMSSKMASSVAKLPPATQESSGPRRDNAQLREYMERATDFYMRGFTARHYRDIRSLLEEYSGARHGANFFTKQDDIIYDILDRSLEVRSSISRFEGTNTVVFDDGTRADVDAIVWCTGYQPKLPFLDEAFGDAGAGQSSGGFFDGQTLYKHVFHPRLGDSLAFIGFARPQIGAMPPIAELQARWFGAVLSGESTLPASSAMEEEAVADRSKFEAEKIFSGRLRSSVDFAKYTSDVAQKAGCYPDVGFQLLFSDPLLWQAFWLGPVLPQSYRIADAGARGETARAKMKEIYRTFLTRG